MQGDIVSSVLLPLILGFIMFSLGLGLTLGDFRRILAQPRGLLVGMLCHFLLLPLVLGPAGHAYPRSMASPVMRQLGTISYGIFLWHLFVLETGSRLIGITSFTGWFWLLWPLTVVGTVLFAHVSYVLVERPAQEYSHRRTAAPPPGGAWTKPAAPRR